MTSVFPRVLLVGIGCMLVYLISVALTQLEPANRPCEVTVVVEVLNGCGVHGLADRVGTYLRDRGLDVMYTGNADDFCYDQTLVVNRSGDRSKALVVAEVLGRGMVLDQVSSAFFVDATVIVGSDAQDWPLSK
jgi:hypothetical protein